MNIWLIIAAALSVLALLYTRLVYVGNKGSLHNAIDPTADLWLVVAWIIVVAFWLIWKFA